MQLAPSALHDTAGTLSTRLGWTLNELIIDDTVSLDGPHDRQIAMRLNSDGSSIQLWAIGGTEPADHEPSEDFSPLPAGHHWNSWIHIGRLEADGDPAAILYNAITERLIPAFDTKPLYVGHQPWDQAFDSALSEMAAESTPTKGTSLRDGGPKAHTTPHDSGREDAAQAAPATGTAPDPQTQTEPAAQPAPGPQPTDEAKAAPRRPRQRPAPKADTPATNDSPKPRTARNRTPAKPAAAKTTTGADDKPKPRTARKRTTTKPAADKPTAS
ncbi:hypothetical protein [Streptomyces sp. NPDC059378]|uniref:hypothetical protein n=1 Tax=Streptomyces sp. NPDC059378 TaxID=3346815 RepID=UPI0036BAA3D2